MIAESIATYLKEHGIKQAALGRQTGLSRRCLSLSLRGMRKISVEEYGMICDALKVPYDFFFREVNDQKPERGGCQRTDR